MISGGFGVPKDKRSDGIANFKKIKGVNILDISGSEDLKHVMDALKI